MCQTCHRPHPSAQHSLEFNETICDHCYAMRLVDVENDRHRESNLAFGQSLDLIRTKRRSGEWPDYPR